MDAKQRESNEAGEQPQMDPPPLRYGATGCRFRQMRRPRMISARMQSRNIRRLHRLRRFRLRVAHGQRGKNAIWRNLDSGEVRMEKGKKRREKITTRPRKGAIGGPLSRFLLRPFHLSMPFLRSLQLARHSFSDGWPFRGYSDLNSRSNIGPAGFEPTIRQMMFH